MNEKFEALKTAAEYIDNLKNGIGTLVEYINQGNYKSGVSLIPQIADGIDWLVQLINLTNDLHKGKACIGNINENLEQIIDAIDNEDFTLVGDLFNYEILPVLEDVQINIRSIVKN